MRLVISNLYSKFWFLILKAHQILLWSYLRSTFKDAHKDCYIEMPAQFKGTKYISLGKKFRAATKLRLEAIDRDGNLPELNFGEHVTIENDCHIGCCNKIYIGNNVLIASRVYITDHSHGGTDISDLSIIPTKRKIISKGPVIINDNVWIGEGSMILPGVEIGESSIIGANSVVTKSFPANSVIAGVPAKLIK